MILQDYPAKWAYEMILQIESLQDDPVAKMVIKFAVYSVWRQVNVLICRMSLSRRWQAERI